MTNTIDETKYIYVLTNDVTLHKNVNLSNKYFIGITGWRSFLVKLIVKTARWK